MTLNEQIKIVKKYIKFVQDNKNKWVDSGKVTELAVNYDIECLEYAVNSLTELRQFELNIIAKNERNVK